MLSLSDICAGTIEDETRFAIDEPLRQLARFTFDWAPSLCSAHAPCAHYHRAWSTIRYIESNGALPVASRLFQDGIEHALRGGRPSVLISGAADTALVAIVNEAMQDTRISPIVTFVDQCATTVEQNRLYARHLGLTGKFISCDARTIHETNIDVILAHNFLLFFDEVGIHSLFEAWSRALNPGGEILMCQTIRAGDGSGSSGYGSRQGLTEERVTTLKARAFEMNFSTRDIDDIDHVCSSFWTSTIQNHPVTEKIFFSALEKSRFEIATCVKIHANRNSSPAHFSGAQKSQSEKYFLTIRKI